MTHITRSHLAILVAVLMATSAINAAARPPEHDSQTGELPKPARSAGAAKAPAAAPDLIITAFNAPASIMLVEDFKATLSVTIQNVGTADYIGNQLRVQVRVSGDAIFGNSDDFTVTTRTGITNLTAGSSRVLTFVTAVMPPQTVLGAGFLLARVDPNNVVNESDENNNDASRPVTITSNPTLRTVYFEDFQGSDGGWTSESLAGGGGPFWNHQVYQGAGVMWCGTNAGLASPPGYGNAWDQYLTKSFVVPVNGATVSYDIQYDSEPSYDFTTLQASTDGVVYNNLASYSGNSNGFVSASRALPVSAGQTVYLRWRFTSDGGWSNEDGLYPGNGGARLDNITVTGLPTDTFEAGNDGWTAGSAQSAGEGYRLVEQAYCPPEAGALCHSYNNGKPVDPCWQWVAYDPFTLQFPVSAPGSQDADVRWAIESPVIPLPTDATTYFLRFDVFGQLPLTSGIFYTAQISAPAGAPWKPYAFVLFSNAWTRTTTYLDLTNLVTIGAPDCKIRLIAEEENAQCGGDGLCGPGAGPYFDNVRLVLGGGSNAGAIDDSIYPRSCNTSIGDFDGDGVSDPTDLDPTISAVPFDRDGDGRLDDIRGGRHIEYIGDGGFPISYAINELGAPGISLAGTVSAVQAAFNAWTTIPNTNVSFDYTGTTAQKNASGLDGVNLVTFADTEFKFPTGVLAVGLSTSFTKATTVGSIHYRPGQIADTDMIFNPDQAFRAGGEGPASGSDIQSVATHEAGHLIGLSHSSVQTSTMFYVLPPAGAASSLETEDKVAALKAYYNPAALSSLSQLSGTVTDGYTGKPIGGAIVFAIDAATQETLGCEYTLADGSYQFIGLPTGSYYVAIHPLDKTSSIGYIGPENINELIYGIAQTTFVPESYDAAESSTDNAADRTAVSVTAGSSTTGIDIISNIDATPPTVVAVSPSVGATDVVIDPAVLVAFTEAISDKTLSGNFSLRDVATNTFVPGNAALVEDGTTLAFVPTTPLAFLTTYQVKLDTGIKDLFGNALAAPYLWTFTTEPQPPVAITLLSPSKAGAGSIVAISGFGFDASSSNNSVTVSGQPVQIVASDPNQLAVKLPASLSEGGHPIVVTNLVTSQSSNVLTFTVLADEELPRGFDAGSAVLGGVPRTIHVLNDGERAFVSTDQGVSAVVVDPGAANYLTTVSVPITNGVDDLTPTPDGEQVYAVSTDATTIYRINADPAHGPIAVLNETEVDFVPASIAIEPSGRRAFISTESGSIYIWDTQPGSVTFDREIGVMSSPFTTFTGGMAIDAAGKYLLALTGTGQMAVFDLGLKAYSQSVPVGPRPHDIVIDPAGERAYVTDDNGVVAVIRLDTFQPVVDISAGGQLRGIVSGPSGAYAHAVDRALNFLNIIDLREDSPRFRSVAVRVPQPNDPVDVAMSPDGLYAFTVIESNHTLHVNAIGVGPTIESLSPRAAPVGALVVIGGKNFVTNNVTSVTFGGVTAPVVRKTEHTIETHVPAGAASATVVVKGTTTGGVAATSNELFFTVLGASGTGMLNTLASVSDGATAMTATISPSPLGTLVAVGGAGGELALFDTDPTSDKFNTFVKTISALGGPVDDVRFTPDGSRLYAVRSGLNEVRCYDGNRLSPSFGLLTGTIVLPASGAKHLAVSPDGHVLLIANPATSAVYVADIREGSATENTVTQTVSPVDGGLGTNGVVGEMAFHPVGDHAYLLIQDDSPAAVSVLTVNTETASASFAGNALLGGSETPVSLSFTPDGSSCLVLTSALAGPASRTVFTLSTATPGSPTVAGSQPLAASTLVGDERIRVSPRGDRAVVPLRNDGYKLLDITARPVLTILGTTTGAVEASPLDLGYGPSGDVLYTAATATNQVVVQDFLATARSIAMVSGDGQTAVMNNEFAAPLRVRVTASASGVKGIPVTFVVTQGDGSFVTSDGAATPTTIAASTDADGYAQARLRAGTTTGTNSHQVTASAVGVAGSPATFTLSTLTDPALLPLSLVSVSPSSGATAVSASSSVVAKFSRPLDVQTAGPATFYLLDVQSNTAVPTVVGFGNNDQQASLTPVDPLGFSKPYSVLVGFLKDLSGNTLVNPTTLTFTTEAPPPLSLDSASPHSAVPGVEVVLSGRGFAATASGNTVRFAGVQASVREVSNDFIRVLVPQDALSGNVTVQTSQGTSNGIPFDVLTPRTSPVDDVVGNVSTGSSSRSISITPDGGLAYAVSPDANLVVVIDLKRFRTIANIPVTQGPYALTVHPAGDRVYVANIVSGTVSVIDSKRGDANFNTVVGSISVGTNPMDLAVSPDGDRVVVANAGSKSLSIIDGDEHSNTYHQVLATASTGSSARSVVITPDGGRWFIGNETGYIVVDPLSRAVLATGTTGTTTRSTAITPDGTLLIVLNELGQLFAFDVAPGSPSANQVLATASSGSSSRSVAISPDGAFLYVVQEKVDAILVYSLKIPRGNSALGPDAAGTPFSLTQVGTVNAGENPSAVAFDPSGSGLLVVANDGDQSVSVMTDNPGVIQADVRVMPDALGPGISASVELSPAFSPQDVNATTVTLHGSGSVPVLPGHTTISDTDQNGIDELHLFFDRLQFQQVIPQGESVTLTVSGNVGALSFSGSDVVTSYVPEITAPSAQAVDPDANFLVKWTTPPSAGADAVDVYWSMDDGLTWTPIALMVSNAGEVLWHVPDVTAANARILVRLYRNGAPVGSGVSAYPFVIQGPIAVRLSQFDARVEKGAVNLSWKTNLETSLAGFRVVRSAANSPERYVTDDMIVPRGAGSAYELTDKNVRPAVEYRYRLVEVSRSGEETLLQEARVTVRLTFDLEQNVPNPFNPATTIAFVIPEDANVSLAVYDVAGRLVRTLVDAKRRAAYYEINWDGTDNRGAAVASGVYFYRLAADKHVATRKMVLLK